MLDRIQNANRSTIAIGAIVLAIILFMCVNLISSLTLGALRIDTTEQQLYSVSDDTRRTLEAIEEPITLRLYLSSTLRDADAEVRIYSQRVIELLKTYETLGKGMLRVERIDPAPLSVQEDEALGYNLFQFVSEDVEAGYFGLVGTNTVDGVETIPYFDLAQERSLEYDLTRLVARLSNREEPIVGVLDGLGLMQAREDGSRAAIIQSLDRDFQLLAVPLDALQIPPEIDALLIIHPAGIIPTARYAIDQYIINGGSALVLLDASAQGATANNPASYLEPVLAAWGLEMAQDRVVGDPTYAISVTLQQTQQSLPYLAFMRFTEAAFNATDPVAGALNALAMMTPGSLRPLPGATTTFTPLVVTSDQGGWAPLSAALQPQAFFLNFEQLGPQVVAARITGNITTAFPDGPPPPPDTGPGGPVLTPPPLVRQSVRPINIIVVADTDIIADDFVTAGTVNNDDFITNALETLVGGTGLTGLRARGVISRPFVTLDEIEARANATFAEPIQQRQAALEQTELDLNNILARVPGGQIFALPVEQQEEVQNLFESRLTLRREIRDLESQRRAEIGSVESSVRVLNILTVPAIVILLGLAFAFWRRARLARYLRLRRAAA